MLVVTRSPVGTCSTMLPSGAITEMQPEIRVATQTLPQASTASASNQMFDSLAVAAGGNVGVATLISGCISVIAPDGSIVEQVPTGDRVTTNIAFGGPELKTAYITLSGKGELIAVSYTHLTL